VEEAIKEQTVSFASDSVSIQLRNWGSQSGRWFIKRVSKENCSVWPKI